MRFLADENIHSSTVNALRVLGHDVRWIFFDAPGISDEEILEISVSEERVLITYDTDFGDLIFHRNLPADCGVILLRCSGSVQDHTVRLLEVLTDRDDWSSFFSAVEDTRVRRRLLPRRA